MRYFIIVASRDHVLTGVEGGFAQAGHGKKIQLDKPAKDDWIIYYSSKDMYENGHSYQKFTAIGQVVDQQPYQVVVRDTFIPWRRNVAFRECNEVEIRPLLDDLDFVTNRKRWGLHLLSGFVEIKRSDFELISRLML